MRFRLRARAFVVAAAVTATFASLHAPIPSPAGADSARNADAPPVGSDEWALERTREFAAQPHEAPGQPAMRLPRHTGAPLRGPAQFLNFTHVQVNVDSSGANITGDAANEPSIAVDPLFPNRIAIGWRQFGTVASSFRQAGVGFSRDGGRTWTVNGPLQPSIFRSDPVLSHSAEGVFYYNSLKVEDGNYTCQVFQSNNGGQTWAHPPVDAQGGDKAWMTVDRSGGIGHGNLYSAWSTAAGCCGNNTFARSTNGNVTWGTASSIPQFPRWGTMDVAPNGDLWVVGTGGGPNMLLASVSLDAKNSALPPLFFTLTLNIGGNIVAGLGGGSPNPAGLLGQAWIEVDKSSGPTAGWIYIVSSVDPPGSDPMDVHFVRSTDGGLNWSAPIKLNSDAFNDAWNWMATMSVAPNGRIDVIWNDTRNTGVANESELYYTSSSNGGFTWTANQQISAAWDSHVGWPMQEKIGDYYHMISDNVGAHLAWSATFNGEQDVYYLRIGDYDCNVNGIADSLDIATFASADLNANGIPDECEEDFHTSDPGVVPATWALYPNVPNPFNPSTRIDFEVSRADVPVRVSVFDVRGRHVRTLVASHMPVGRQSVEWDGRDDDGRALGSGVYVVRLQTSDAELSRRMVMIR